MTVRELIGILEAAPEELHDVSVYIERDGVFRIARAIVFALPRCDDDGTAWVSLVTGRIVKHPDPDQEYDDEPDTTERHDPPRKGEGS